MTSVTFFMFEKFDAFREGGRFENFICLEVVPQEVHQAYAIQCMVVSDQHRASELVLGTSQLRVRIFPPHLEPVDAIRIDNVLSLHFLHRDQEQKLFSLAIRRARGIPVLGERLSRPTTRCTIWWGQSTAEPTRT